MDHSEQTFERVLAVFQRQDHANLTPSFVAQRLDQSAEATERLLDDMVKQSLLELDFDDNGQLFYSISPDAPARYHRRRPGPPVNDWSAPAGADGAVSQPTQRQAHHQSGQRPQQRRHPQQHSFRPHQPRPQPSAHGADPAGRDGSLSGSPAVANRRPTADPRTYNQPAASGAPSSRPVGRDQRRQRPSQRHATNQQPAARQTTQPQSARQANRQRYTEMVRRSDSSLTQHRTSSPLLAAVLAYFWSAPVKSTTAKSARAWRCSPAAQSCGPSHWDGS